ncbi:MAG: DoxX family protein [Bacteroidetes bacterium]|nr:DoxX family protein [Bacteroidota bacterium]
MRNFLSSKLFKVFWTGGLAVLLYVCCPPCFSKNTLSVLLVTLFTITNVFPYVADAKGATGNVYGWFTQIVRLFVGGLFIFSGFIKANDPLGFSYKLEEYFEVFKNDTGMAFFEYFAHISLPLAIIICASEIILGVMLLLGTKRDLTLWLLLAQIVFFTFLTFYSACYNKVTHCGCFGDFLKLKPWESFWKDVILMIAIAVLFSGKKNINPIASPMVISALFLLGLIFSIGFPVYAYRNLPPLDFRAYAPGMNIKENMKVSPDYQPPVIETGFIYENTKTGKKEHFNLKNYPWQDTLNWKWFATDNVIVKDAVNAPKITDFTVSNLEGSAITDSVLNDKNYSFWLVMYDLKKTETNPTLMAKIKDFDKLAEEEKFKFIALTASGPKDIEEFKKEHGFTFEFATVDGTVLKTMIRSNPGLMLMKDGTVIKNWHRHNFPTFSDVKQRFMK